MQITNHIMYMYKSAKSARIL